jgi:hypothetical protein
MVRLYFCTCFASIGSAILLTVFYFNFFAIPIFSAQAPSFVWKPMPSLWLVGSVLVTVADCIVLPRFIPRFGASCLSSGSAILAKIMFFPG